MPSHVAILRSVDLFKNLTEFDLTRISAICKPLAVKAGEVIFEENSLGDEIYICSEGRVSIEMRIMDDRLSEQIHQVKEHEVFGEIALLDGHRRSARTRAVDNLNLLVIRREALVNLMDEEPRIGYFVMTNLSRIVARRLRDTNLSLRNMMAQQRFSFREMT